MPEEHAMKVRGATFTLSLDVEMAWGSWRSGRWPWEAFAAEPDVVRRLDEMATSLGLPMTFGVVGALAGVQVSQLRDLDPTLGIDVAFPELAGAYPAGSVPLVGQLTARPESWLDQTVIPRLRSSPAGHEVCSHTFFHALPRSADRLPQDVAVTRRAVGDVSSLIFPKDSIDFVASLPSAGVNAYRGTGESAYMRARGKPRRIGRLTHLVEQAVGRPAPLAQVVSGSVTCLTTSAYLTLRTGIRRRIPARALRKRFITPLYEAVRCRGNYHLWTHPWNLALPGSDGLDLLGEVLTTAAALQDRGDLMVRTMRQLTDDALPTTLG
jgi:hypothetical protein